MDGFEAVTWETTKKKKMGSSITLKGTRKGFSTFIFGKTIVISMACIWLFDY